MNNYLARWNAARDVCKKINTLLEADDTLRIEYDGEVFFEEFDIDEEFKEITLDSENTSHLIFSGDPEVDEGIHETKDEWMKHFKKRVKLFKEVHYDL